MSLISVIIPVYNVEKYLDQCVNSVLDQEFKDIEVILVDDGSTDNSPLICDTFMKKDDRVKVIHKKNGGLSDARNYGIRIATGDFLMFLDSDDYWENNSSLFSITDVLLKRNDIDVLVFGSKLLYEGQNKLIEDATLYDNKLNTMKNEDALKYLVSNDLLVGSACTKTIKNSFLKNHSLYFQKGIKSEDVEWIIRVANCLPKYYFMNEKFYIYRKGRQGSITSNIDFNHLEGYRKFLKMNQQLDFENKEIKYILTSYISYQYTILCGLTARLKDKRKYELINKLKEMDDLLDFDLHPKVQKVKKVYKVSGFYLTVYVLGLYLKLRK